MSHSPILPFTRAETHISHRGFHEPDLYAPRERPGSTFLNALLATALMRCWHILVLFAAWATLIAALNDKGYGLFIQSTLLTVVGTVLGFVISYRTTSSFERYNEGRRLWSQVILATRTFARTLWIHVTDQAATATVTADEMASSSLIEKKTVINLLEAFAVSLKHYLRSEDGIHYEDLYYLVKFLPAYSLPPNVSPSINYNMSQPLIDVPAVPSPQASASFLHHRQPAKSPAALPFPVTSSARKPSFFSSTRDILSITLKERFILTREDEKYLLPAHRPPKYHIFDLFPFSMFVECLLRRGQDIKGKTATKIRVRMRQGIVSHNLPLEISLYISSYIAALQTRKQVDVPTINALLAALNQNVDALTGLERVLTTPIPFSYSIHLWMVTMVYCFFLPFQIWSTLKWLTIPATVIISFMFFGFVVAGEEIENPFGYDRNDLDLDHFTDIVKNELQAITSAPPPDPSRWAFVAENNVLFSKFTDTERVPPSDWMQRGHVAMQKSLGTF